VARSNISETLQLQVRERALGLCEYCHTLETWQYVPFTLDHVIPLSLGGGTVAENLALACFHCNRRKSSNAKAVDPETNEEVALYNPRLNTWREHFIWSEDNLTIIALTPVGRATVERLDLNRERVLLIRAEDKAVGRHPPVGDPIQSNEV
jgi:exopolyphosphatase/pppGpp-phosphohydrolase